MIPMSLGNIFLIKDHILNKIETNIFYFMQKNNIPFDYAGYSSANGTNDIILIYETLCNKQILVKKNIYNVENNIIDNRSMGQIIVYCENIILYILESNKKTCSYNNDQFIIEGGVLNLDNFYPVHTSLLNITHIENASKESQYLFVKYLLNKCNIESISLYGHFIIKKNGPFWPNYIKEIYIDYSFNQKVMTDILPNLFDILHLNKCQQLYDINLNNVKELYLGNKYNYVFETSLQTCKILHIGDKFDKKIDLSKCPNLEELQIGQNFNNAIDLSQCLKLKILKLGYSFNQPIHFFPNSLKIVWFGRHFNQGLTNLPDSLEELYIPRYYYKKINPNIKNVKIF